MPELPEVETVVRDLAPLVTGARITRVQLWDPTLVRYPKEEAFGRRLTGRIIRSIGRRGKYIRIELDQDLTWLVHLRMTGRLVARLEPQERYRRAQFDLDNGEVLYYCDLRRFGDMWVLWPGEEEFGLGYTRLGPEPLNEEFSAAWLGAKFSGRKGAVKSLLLDQGIVAGLGNIYVDESLHLAGINPARPGGSLKRKEIGNLVQAVKEVLGEAIEGRGTTFRDYRGGLGEAGEHQLRLRVYGRAGQPCRRCGQNLAKLKIGGRTTVFCPHCQD